MGRYQRWSRRSRDAETWARTGLGALAIFAGAHAEAGAQQPEAAASAASALVFDGVTVVDVERGKLLPDRRVVIVGNRIRAVGTMRAVKPPQGAQVVDAHGKYLIPGLWDLHVHPFRQAPDRFYPHWIAYGVTGIRDAHSDVPLDTQRQWRQEILAGTRVGPPRQILTGLALDDKRISMACNSVFGMDGTGHICLKTPADVRRTVDSLKAAGADMIKTYFLSREMYFALAAEARRLGIPFGGHLLEMSVKEASDSGARILDHVHRAGGLDTACLRATATIERCRGVAEQLRRTGAWWVPTLVSTNNCPTEGTGPASYHLYAGAARFVRESAADSGFRRYVVRSAAPRDTIASQCAKSPPPRGLLELAQRVGLPILAATDTPGGYSFAGAGLHTELAIYVAEGLTPLTALQSATLNPAKMWRATDSLGTVAAGKLADLVLLDADPLADISNTTAIRAVVANGRYFDRAALDQMLIQAR